MVDSLASLQVPPHNIEAEKNVLAGVFVDPELLNVYDGLALNPFDFYDQAHQHIYAAIKTLVAAHRPIDILTVTDQMTKDKTLDQSWGEDYVYSLPSYLVNMGSCGDYAQIVKEKSILRQILKTCTKISADVFDQKDPREIIDTIEKRIFDLTQLNMRTGLVHIKDVLDKRIEDYMELVDNPDLLEARKTLSQYHKLDDMLNGFKSWELIILAARPAMGKTSFAVNLLINAAISQRKSVALFSLEMTAESIADRVLSTMSTIPMHKIAKAQLDNDDYAKMGEAMQILGDVNIYVDDSGWLTIPELKSKLRRLRIEKWALDLVVIDYLQLMSGVGSKWEGNRVQEISQISRGLKELSKELAVPIIALSQLSRNVESRIDKKPQLSDLRESGAIEQDADVVLMIHREDYYDPDTDKKGVTDILIRKNRNWPTGEVSLMFKSQTMKFEEYEWPTGNSFGF